MSVIGEWWRRLWFLLNRRRLESTLQVEMESHRAMMTDARRFGNVLRLREESRDVWGWAWLDDLSRDMRYALRSLARAPGFTAVAVLSLALATGATTTIFSIVNGVILRPLPFGHPDRLVQVYGRNWGRDEGSVPDPLTGPVGRELEAYNQQSTLLESTAGYDLTTLHLAGPSGTERLKAVRADLTTAVQLSAALLFVALVAFAVLLLYSRSVGLLRADVQPDALTLYLRMAVFVVPLVPVLAFLVAAVAPWAGLAMLVGLNLLGLLPLESHQPPAGVERGPRPASSRSPRRVRR